MKNYYTMFFSIFLLTSCLSKDSSLLQFKAAERKTASTAVAEDVPLEQSGLTVRMSDRFYVSSLLLDVFGPSAGQPVHDFIKVKMDNFGGGCDQYDYNVNSASECLNEDCGKIWCSGVTVIDNQIGVSSVIRQGWITRACEEIANSDAAILHSVKNIFGQPTLTITSAPVPTNESLNKAYMLFFRSTNANANIISSLNTIATLETSNNFEKWRYVLLSLCTSSEWQIP